MKNKKNNQNHRSELSKGKLTNKLSHNIVSPEQFDELIDVVDSKNWLFMLSFGSMLGLILLWSIFGKIPINVTGKGVLVYPRQINDLQSPLAGTIEELKIKNGECIEKDRVIAIINPDDIKQKLEQEKVKLTQLETQDNRAVVLQREQTNLKNRNIEELKASKQQRLATAQALTPLLQQQGITSIAQQKANIQQKSNHLQQLNPLLQERSLASWQKQRISLLQQYQNAEEILPKLKDRWSKRRLLQENGSLSSEQVLQAEQAYRDALQNKSNLEAQLQELEVERTKIEQQYVDNLNKIGEYQTQLQELRVKETEAQQKYQENLSLITQLQAEIKDLDAQKQQLTQHNFQSNTTRENHIQETRHNVARLQKEYDDRREIKSPVAGCMLEFTATVGQVTQVGTRLGAIALNNESSELVAVTYFPIADGKKIQLGMNSQITPDTVRRERFGGIVSKVVGVSAFPVTKEAARAAIGNSEVIEALAQNHKGAFIEVNSKLELDPNNFSGYQWSSSSGPSLKVTQGTTTTARIKIGERAPISFILPLFRKWTGIY